jgi:hypothetical protein
MSDLGGIGVEGDGALLEIAVVARSVGDFFAIDPCLPDLLVPFPSVGKPSDLRQHQQKHKTCPWLSS